MIAIQPYLNPENNNTHLPSRITSRIDSLDIYWFHNSKTHRTDGGYSVLKVDYIEDDSRYIDDNGFLVDIPGKNTVIEEGYRLFAVNHNENGPADINYRENKYQWFLYGHRLEGQEFKSIKKLSEASSWPLWVEFLIMKKYITAKEISQVVNEIPYFFDNYPIRWVVSVLNLETVVDNLFMYFYDIVDLKK